MNKRKRHTQITPSPAAAETEVSSDGGVRLSNFPSVNRPHPSVLAIVALKRDLRVLPIHSDWFSPSSIDRIEQQVVPAMSLKAIDSLIQFDKAKCMLKAADVYPELVSRGHQTSDQDSMIRVALNETCCNHCPRPLAAVYYRSQKEVAFLASAVGPRVAAACAHASLATLSIGDRTADLGKLGIVNGSASGNRMNLESRNANGRGPSADITNLVQQKDEVGQDDIDDLPLCCERVQKAARASMSAAAMKAKLFADHEEREIQRLFANTEYYKSSVEEVRAEA